MMHNIIPTLLSLTLVVGLAAACGGPSDDPLDSNAGAATSKSRKNTCTSPSDGTAADVAPGTGVDDGSGSSGSEYLTCWCNTSQGTGDGSGCYFAVTGPGCAGECECTNICGELED